MRTIKQLPIPQDGNDTLFPDGQIRNETDIIAGTPVVREIYGDVLTNIYAIMRDAGIVPNGTEDSSTSGYQFLQALKQFANEINDVNQVITVSGTNITVGFDVALLPNKYIFTGVLSDDISAGTPYLINGVLTLTPTSNISASSQVFMILDTSGAKIYALNAGDSGSSDVHIPFEYPFGYNDTDEPYYLINGRTLTDFPRDYNTESLIRTAISTSTINVLDGIFIKGNALYLCIDTSTNEYSVFRGLSSVFKIGINSEFADDKGVNLMADGDYLYFTNSDATGLNSVDNDYSIAKYEYNETAQTLTFVSDFVLDSNFEKTTNYFIVGDGIFTFIEGNLYRYPMDGSPRVFAGFFNSVNGIVFKLNNNVYFSSGEFAKKWNV